MTERIGAGVVGLGFIGPVHVDAVRRLGFAEVVAIAGSSAEKAQAVAARLGVPNADGDWRALIARPEVQVVHVCTPNDSHYPITRAALLAGKHVISEKPLAMNTQESAELAALAQERGLVNAVAFTYRGYPVVKQARAMIARGDLGEILLVHGTYVQDWLLHPTDYNWRVEPEVSGPSRAIADIGTHWFNTVEYVTGRRFRCLLARLSTVYPTRQRPRRRLLAFEHAAAAESDTVAVTTEDVGTLMFELDNGALASTVISQVSAGRKNWLGIEVDGAQGSLYWNQEDADRLWHGRRDAPNQIIFRDPTQMDPAVRWSARLPVGHPEGYADAFRTLFEPAYRRIAGEESNGDYPDFAEGHRAMQFVEAVLQSHREGRWVDL